METYNKYTIVVFLITLISCNNQKNEDNVRYKRDSIRVVNIAENTWLKYYGKNIYSNKPFKAHKKDSIWIVRGTLHTDLGGVPYLEINAKNFKVLKISHGK